jgi:hypothetical protein
MRSFNDHISFISFLNPFSVLCQQVGVVHYPFHSLNRTPKTHEMFVSLFNDRPDLFETLEAATRDLRFGVEKRSPLLDLRDFDLVEDIPLDAMHLLHLGITKKTYERMFDTDLVWKASVRNKIKERLNNMLSKMKVPSEITRKMYGVLPAKMKASQWQTLDTFCFCHIAVLLSGNRNLQHVLFLYTFLVRLCYGTDEDYEKVRSKLNLSETMNTFYRLYSKVFGAGCFTFNLHSFLHLLSSRERNGPLWTHSTAKYESLYAATRRCYDGRTYNTPKQLLENFYSASLTNHKCNEYRNITLADKSTAKTDDTLVYCKDGFYLIVQVLELGLTVRKLITTNFDSSAIVDLPWRDVGVATYQTVEDLERFIRKEDVVAKAVLCGNIISVCHTEWLLT